MCGCSFTSKRKIFQIQRKIIIWRRFMRDVTCNWTDSVPFHPRCFKCIHAALSQQTMVFGECLDVFRGAQLAVGGLGSYLGSRPRFPAPTTHLQRGETHQPDSVSFPVYTGCKQPVPNENLHHYYWSKKKKNHWGILLCWTEASSDH